MDLQTRAKTRMEVDEEVQFKNVIEWARRNPQKDVDVYALDEDERDRLRALLVTLSGENSPPKNILVSVRPEDYNAPVHVRTQ
jgi:hypothetical protein